MSGGSLLLVLGNIGIDENRIFRDMAMSELIDDQTTLGGSLVRAGLFAAINNNPSILVSTILFGSAQNHGNELLRDFKGRVECCGVDATNHITSYEDGMRFLVNYLSTGELLSLSVRNPELQGLTVVSFRNYLEKTQQLPANTWVYICPMPTDNQATIVELVREKFPNDIRIMLTTHQNLLSGHHRDDFLKILDSVDVLSMNQAEILSLGQRSDADSLDQVGSMISNKLRKDGIVFVTRGSQGSSVYTEGYRAGRLSPNYSGDIKSQTGLGDAFSSGVLLTLMLEGREYNKPATIKRAIICGQTAAEFFMTYGPECLDINNTLMTRSMLYPPERMRELEMKYSYSDSN